MTVQLLLDLVMIGLLVSTVVYCTALSRKINQLRTNKKELGELLNHFNTAIAQADHSISELKTLGDAADGKLRHHIEKARVLVNDLSFLADRGENAASALENQIHSSRSLQASNHRSSAPEEMPLSKKLALEELLQQIADRKAAVRNPSELKKRQAAPQPAPAKPKQETGVFKGRHLAELVKMSTQ